MARYEHLPIYKAAPDLTVHFEQVVAGFSRYHKYTLGTELREASRGVLMQVREGQQRWQCACQAGRTSGVARAHRGAHHDTARGQGGEGIQEFCGLPACSRAGGLAGQTERRLVQAHPGQGLRWAKHGGLNGRAVPLHAAGADSVPKIHHRAFLPPFWERKAPAAGGSGLSRHVCSGLSYPVTGSAAGVPAA